MPLSEEQLQTLDPSICRLPLFWEQSEAVPEGLFLFHYRGDMSAAKRSFWHLAFAVSERWTPLRPDWVPRLRLSGFEVQIQFLEFDLISEERLEAFETPSDIIREPTPVHVSWGFSELMKECSPQFFLRNLPRAQRDIELSEPLWFDLTDSITHQAFDDIDEGREAEIPQPEFMDHWSLDYVDDFRVFLNEIKYLCPWDKMPRHQNMHQVNHRVEAGIDLWDTQYSNAQLSVQLLDRARSGRIFAIGTAGRLTSISIGPRRRQVVARRKSKLPDEEVRPVPESTVGNLEYRLGASEPTPIEVASDDERMG